MAIDDYSFPWELMGRHLAEMHQAIDEKLQGYGRDERLAYGEITTQSLVRGSRQFEKEYSVRVQPVRTIRAVPDPDTDTDAIVDIVFPILQEFAIRTREHLKLLAPESTFTVAPSILVTKDALHFKCVGARCWLNKNGECLWQVKKRVAKKCSWVWTNPPQTEGCVGECI